jgi:hypothetical protein
MESQFCLLKKNVVKQKTWPACDQLRLAIVTGVEVAGHCRRSQDG